MPLEVETERDHPPSGAGAVEGQTLAFEAFGLRIGMTLCEPFSPEDLAPVLPPWRKPILLAEADHHFRLVRHDADSSPNRREGFHWYDAGGSRRFAATFEGVIKAGGRIVEHLIVEHATTQVFVHAGVVAWRGQAVILPGKSFSGKSTLVTALVNAGATYLSDEYAPLDRAGLVAPFPRHLSQRNGPYGTACQIDLAHRAPNSPDGIPVALVLLLKHEAGESFHCERLSHASAMMAMSEHTIGIRERPAEAFAALGRVAEAALTMKGVRGEADLTARVVLDALDAVTSLPDDLRAEWLAEILSGCGTGGSQ